MLKISRGSDEENDLYIQTELHLFYHSLVFRVGSRIDRFVVLSAIGGSEVLLRILALVISKLSSLASPTSHMTVFKKFEERDKVASYSGYIAAFPGMSSI